MATIRGFVEGLEIGRAGLVVVALVKDDDSRASYQLADLDADPERFNERLSKLGVLRDAMTACEPVEIEFVQEGSANLIERVRRITRDSLSSNQATTRVSGSVMGVAVTTQNRTGPSGEAADVATVVIVGSGAPQSFQLNMQTPERQVAEAQLDMLRGAQASGETVSVDVVAKDRRIVAVYSGDFAGTSSGGKSALLDGFVESIAHSQLAQGSLMAIELTTAPPFESTLAGNVVKLEPFVPTLVRLAVVRGSPEYELFEAALRDKLRVRVMTVEPRSGDDNTGDDNGSVPISRRDPAAAEVAASSVVGLSASRDSFALSEVGANAAATVLLVRGAQLLHALASAARPVWIQVQRRSLDVGPDVACNTDGLPSNDLTPRSLRDLALPYKAEWAGWGCFNHGVYRFQLSLATPFELIVDNVSRCVHASDDGKVQFAHACLDGEHEVRIVLDAWTCKQDFVMDVYRIR
jgi:hypothetical protein